MSLFPDITDPWMDTKPGEISSAPIVARESRQPETSYITELIEPNEELMELYENIQGVEIPSNYTKTFNENIRSDGNVEYITLERLFDKTDLNQLSIESIVNFLTMNNRIEFTELDRPLWNVCCALIAFEQLQLGHGNFVHVRKNMSKLPSLILPDSSSAQHSSIWSPTASSHDSSANGVSDKSNGRNGNGKTSEDGANMAYSVSSLQNFVEIQDLRKLFKPNSHDTIKVIEIPEKEGLVFKHINYLVAHSDSLNEINRDVVDNKKVVRRYSDFVWLYEVLIKKYPFRMIPNLPPKRFSGSSSDPMFLERRRRGLARFLNLISKHPVLRKEPLYLMFLTIASDLTSWRKQSDIEVIDEFEGRRITKQFIQSWTENGNIDLAKLEKSAISLQNNWNKISLLVERFEKRKQLFNMDNQKFIEALNFLPKDNVNLYGLEPTDVSTVNLTLKKLTVHLNTQSELLKDESSLVEDGLLKDFRDFNEYLLSFINLLERLKRNNEEPNIQITKNKIEINQKKLNDLKKDRQKHAGEIDTLIQIINHDKEVVIKQTNKDWLIKESVLQEYAIFQETQYLITKIFKDWVSDRLKYTELHSENWSQLLDSFEELPLESE